MKIYCIYFDLNEPEQQLTLITDYLRSFNAGIRAGDNLWFVKSTKSPQQIRDNINALNMLSGYHVLAFETGSKWATHNTRDIVDSWMGKHV